jgi:hypothetical protein
MKQSSVIVASAIAVALAMFVPCKSFAQGVTIYVGPEGYSGPGYDYYQPAYPPYRYGPAYGYVNPYPSYGSGYGYYGRPYYGTRWGQGRRVARRVNRRWNRWY